MESQRRRIDQLDGLRGIAIILVIINHLRLTPLFTLLPPQLQPVLGSILNSGKIGVSILFFLTGFLMATIHPHVSSKFGFLQKRYTRIFPAFVSMCLALTLIRYFWDLLHPIAIIAIVIAVVIIVGLLWRGLIRLPQRILLGKTLFFFFLGLQIVAAIGYVFVLSRVSSAVFYLVWPKWIQSFISFVVNSTVTLPFGNYIAQLDGAYWSIVTEVFFYILYPILFLPIISYIVKKKSYALGGICILLSLPFFYGLSLLFATILGFEMLLIYLAVYFAFGVALGLIAHSSFVTSLQDRVVRIPSAILIIVGLFIAAGMPLFREIFSLPGTIDMLYWVFPISFLMIITLGENGWVRFLRNKPLMLIGKLSYALYLTHTIAIEMFALKFGDPKTVQTMFVYACLSLIVMTLLSSILHYFLEIPYFAYKIAKSAKEKATSPVVHSYVKPVFIGITAFMVLLWLGYRAPVSLTSKVVNHYDTKLPPLSIVTSRPITLHFTGAASNLGMILFHIKPLSDSELKKLNSTRGGATEESLIVDVETKDGTKLTTNNYPLYQMYDSPYHPVGLPLDASSQGKPLFVKLYLSAPEVSQRIALVNTDATFRSVYFFDKKTLLSQPSLLGSLLWEKLTHSFMEKDAWIILLLCGPLIGILMVLVLRQKGLKMSFLYRLIRR